MSYYDQLRVMRVKVLQVVVPGLHIGLTALGLPSMGCSMTIDAQGYEVFRFVVPE
jgi:hypothetical protein